MRSARSASNVLRVFDGNSSAAYQLANIAMTTVLPPLLLSTRGALFLELASSGAAPFAGFEACFAALGAGHACSVGGRGLPR
jgi:hypothetical protein